MHGTSQSVFLFRLGSCGAFNEEVALLAEGQLVESCKYKFLWYEEYCMYQGVCPDCLGLLIVWFLPLPHLFHTAQYREHWDQLQSALNTFLWGREDLLSMYLKTVPFPEVPGKGWLLSHVLLLCWPFSAKKSLGRSLWYCPWVPLHLEWTWMTECSFRLLCALQGYFLPDSCSHFPGRKHYISDHGISAVKTPSLSDCLGFPLLSSPNA